jgi:hypothetical protein
MTAAPSHRALNAVDNARNVGGSNASRRGLFARENYTELTTHRASVSGLYAASAVITHP